MTQTIRVLAVALLLLPVALLAHAGVIDTGICKSDGETLVHRFTVDPVSGSLPAQTISGMCGAGRYTSTGSASFDLLSATIAASTSVQQSGASSVQRRIDGLLADVLHVEEGAFVLTFSLDGSAQNGFDLAAFANIRVEKHVVVAPGNVLDFLVLDTSLLPGQSIDTAELRRLSIILPDLSVTFFETFFDIELRLQATSGGLLGQDGSADVRLTAALNAIEPGSVARTGGGLFTEPAVVAEPGAAALLSVGLMGLGILRRRRAAAP
jgi:hypothetical protein